MVCGLAPADDSFHGCFLLTTSEAVLAVHRCMASLCRHYALHKEDKKVRIQVEFVNSYEYRDYPEQCLLQVVVYGMNPKVGLVSFPPRDNQFDKPYSNETAQLIDTEVRAFINTAYERTVALLREKKEFVENMAQALLKEEVLNLDKVEDLLGKRPFTNATLQNIDQYR